MAQLLKAACFIALVLTIGCSTLRQDEKLANQGYAFLIEENYVEAEKAFKGALAINAYDYFSRLNLGVVYQNTGRRDLAREMYERVIKSNTQAIAHGSNKGNLKGTPLIQIAKDNINSL